MKFNKNELVKSPLNYTGGKYKLLPQILPLFPDNIDTFYDVFAGGCNVGVNVKANKIICNDIESSVINLMKYFKTTNEDKVFQDVFGIIKEYNLLNYPIKGNDNYNALKEHGKKSYLNLRQVYNGVENIFDKNILFYTLCCYSFSNQIRFNNKGHFNMPYGERYFNESMQSNLKIFLKKLKYKNIKFINRNFLEINIDTLNKNDFIYCDPPYLITCASYNENGGWDEKRECQLLDLLDNLNSKGIKFAMSNVLENKGKSNDILKDWANKYNIHYLNNSYGNCNYHAKDKSKNSTIEVLITNY